MKLLEDMPSAVTHRPPQRRAWVVLALGVSLLLVAAIAGALLILQSGDSSDSADAESSADVALADWTATASTTCTTVATEHPVLTQATVVAADVAAMAEGTSALATTIREQTLPAGETERTQIGPVVALGDKAEQAWQTLASAGTSITTAQITDATAQQAAFVSGLIELGADCSAVAS